jgi:phosphoglycolate phosphatase-like HAD superfamily hydrolase
MAKRKLVMFDVGGVIRDSSDSMGYALKIAASEHGYDLTLPNMPMWQLWTVKGPKFDEEGGDYKAWFRAAYAIESLAKGAGKRSEDVCNEMFGSEDPGEAVAEAIHSEGEYLDKLPSSEIGRKAIYLFGKEPLIIGLSRLSYSVKEAVSLLYSYKALMGIVSSAPSAESVTGYVEENVKAPLMEMGIIGKDAVLFDPRLVHFGSLSKTDQIEKSVLDSIDILGEDPDESYYLGDTNDDLEETKEANKRLASRGIDEVKIVMIEKGMGNPGMWKKSWKEAGLEPGKNYFEHRDVLTAAAHITGYLT